MNSKLYLIPILFLSLWLISCSKKIVLEEKQKVNKTFEKSNTKLKANLLPFKEGDKFKKTGLFELNKQSWIIESKSLNKIQIQKRIHTLIEKYSSLKLLYEHQKTAALNQRALLESMGHETKEKDEVHSLGTFQVFLLDFEGGTKLSISLECDGSKKFEYKVKGSKEPSSALLSINQGVFELLKYLDKDSTANCRNQEF